MAVSTADVFHAAESRHQHQQGGFGQVEIGQQSLHHPETIAGKNEDVGLAAPRFQLAACRRRLQRAQAGRAHRHDAPSFRLGQPDQIHGLLRHGIPLAVHVVLGDFLHAHRLKSPRADMQRDVGGFHPHLFESFQHRRIEMQPCRRRGHRAGLARINGLIAGFVQRFRSMGDVRRQRQAAVLFQQIQQRGFPGKAQAVKFALPLLHRRRDLARQQQA